ncbi:alpha-2-macroglobulin [Escherichia coli]
MKKLRVASCLLMLALAGCDNNDNAPTAVKKDAPSEVTKAASSENVSCVSKAGAEHKTGPTDAGKALTLLDLSEVQLDGAATLVLSVSPSLSTRIRISHALFMSSIKKAAKWMVPGSCQIILKSCVYATSNRNVI